MTESIFKINMAYLQKLYGKIDSELIPRYWDIFKSKSDEEFQDMVKNIISTFIPTNPVPFPVPAQFLNATGLSGKNRSILAVNSVKEAIQHIGPYKSVSFGDRSLHQTIDRFGGWPEMCTWDLQKWEFNEKRFIACYEASLSDGTGPDKCVGICEYENSDKMHTFTERQRKFAEEANKLKEIGWKGFQKLEQLGYSKVRSKEIRDDSMKSIGEILK